MSKLSVNFNPSAEYAAKNLAQVERRLDKTMEHLSSGQQINSAEDDAAGFAVRERMRSDTAVMQKGLDNLGQGVALVQTAEGALDNVGSILTRMKELATQSASANVSSDRSDLQEEFSQLTAEIDRLANSTEFNGRKLLDNSLSTTGLRIHYGTGNSSGSDYFQLVLNGTRLQDLGLNTTTIDTQENAQQAMDAVDGALDTVTNSLATTGAYQNRLETMQADLQVSLENLQASQSVIADADMAQEMVALTRDQIIQQAGLAALGQANNLPAQAVSVLLGK